MNSLSTEYLRADPRKGRKNTFEQTIRIFTMSGEREKLDAKLEKNMRISLPLRTN